MSQMNRFSRNVFGGIAGLFLELFGFVVWVIAWVLVTSLIGWPFDGMLFGFAFVTYISFGRMLFGWLVNQWQEAKEDTGK